MYYNLNNLLFNKLLNSLPGIIINHLNFYLNKIIFIKLR
jgi:hypothetical protein